MKCRHCKRDGIPDDAVYCCYCGKALRKTKDEIPVPPPRKKADGTYTGRIMVNGVRVTVPAQPTEAKYYAAARAIKSEMVTVQAAPKKITLLEAIEKYKNDRTAVLSPSTLYGYERIKHNRFQDYMDCDVNKIEWQVMINKEATKVSAKTIENAWALVAPALTYSKIPLPSITLPQVDTKELPWLDDDQIIAFLTAMEKQEIKASVLKKSDYKIGALLALHGLRRSEVLAITPSKIVDGKIVIHGSVVISENGMVAKNTNKNKKSKRTVPIMIPLLSYMIAASDRTPDQPFVANGNGLWKFIRNVCDAADLPPCGVQSLRRSFVSLAWSLGWTELQCQLIGGWSDYKTMHEIYLKLSAKDRNKATEQMTSFYCKLGAPPADEQKPDTICPEFGTVEKKH